MTSAAPNCTYMLPRLVFRGQFFAAPSTPNNWSGTYQNTPMDYTAVSGGNWNPFGGADVRILNTRLVDAVAAPNGNFDVGSSDVVIETDYDSSTAKISDQDPMMQMMSRIFRLRIVIKNAATGQIYLRGQMHHTAFSDITGTPNYGPRARYTSALKMAQVSAPKNENAALQKLYDLVGQGELIGITMMVGSHNGNQLVEWANCGTGTYVIGPLCDGLQGIGNHQVVFQRRILPAPSSPSGLKSINTVYMAIAKDSNILTIDMCQSLGLTSKMIANRGEQVTPETRFSEQPIGKIIIAALHSDQNISILDGGKEIVQTGAIDAVIMPGQKLAADQFIKLHELDFTATAKDEDSLLETTGLVFDKELSDQQAEAVRTMPLAILVETSSGQFEVQSRETLAGINIAYTGGRAIATHGRAVGQDTASTRVSVRQYTKVIDAETYPNLLTVAPGSPGNVTTANDFSAFQSAGGKMAYPEKALNATFSDDTLTFVVAKAINSPRMTTSAGYTQIGGQLYPFNVEPNLSNALSSNTDVLAFINQMTGHEQSAMDFISVLAMDTGTPAAPNIPASAGEQEKAKLMDEFFSAHVKPIMQQYANLYPVMSRYLFNLADAEKLQKNANILFFAFTASQTSGHYMPVTRDMPQWQRQTICNWLKEYMTPEQIAETSAFVAAEVAPSLTSDLPPQDVATQLIELAANARMEPTELADIMLDLDVPLEDAREFLKEAGENDAMLALLRAMTKAHRAARGTSADMLDPVAANEVEARRVDVADALRARFADMVEEPDAFGTSKGEAILRMMDSKA